MLSREQILEAERCARRFQGAWTGTSGTLASHVVHLVNTIRELQEPGMATEGEQLLDTAKRTIQERRQTYGPASEHFRRTVGAINAVFASKLREPLTVADWAQIMILDKLARHQEKPHHDNLVDTAGYAACWAECEADD